MRIECFLALAKAFKNPIIHWSTFLTPGHESQLIIRHSERDRFSSETDGLEAARLVAVSIMSVEKYCTTEATATDGLGPTFEIILNISVKTGNNRAWFFTHILFNRAAMIAQFWRQAFISSFDVLGSSVLLKALIKDRLHWSKFSPTGQQWSYSIKSLATTAQKSISEFFSTQIWALWRTAVYKENICELCCIKSKQVRRYSTQLRDIFSRSARKERRYPSVKYFWKTSFCRFAHVVRTSFPLSLRKNDPSLIIHSVPISNRALFWSSPTFPPAFETSCWIKDFLMFSGWSEATIPLKIWSMTMQRL